jgi:hypothetical protein
MRLLDAGAGFGVLGMLVEAQDEYWQGLFEVKDLYAAFSILYSLLCFNLGTRL